jgi:hypothetical protein
MFVGRFAVAAISILTCLLLVSGQQPRPINQDEKIRILTEDVASNTKTIQSLSQQVYAANARAIDLSQRVDGLLDSLSKRIDEVEKSEAGMGQFQISATSFPVGGGMTGIAVYEVNTQTGFVCQVTGPKPIVGETGTMSTLPYCPQETQK